MRNECAVGLAEAFEEALEGQDPQTIKQAREKFMRRFRGSNVYVSMSDPARQLKRNIHIIKSLPRYGEFCSKSKVYDLANKYNLSMSQIYRIRREGKKTYDQLEELYDHGLISKEQHAEYLAALQRKLPGLMLGKSLQ